MVCGTCKALKNTYFNFKSFTKLGKRVYLKKCLFTNSLEPSPPPRLEFRISNVIKVLLRNLKCLWFQFKNIKNKVEILIKLSLIDEAKLAIAP